MATDRDNDDFDPSEYAALRLWGHILEKGIQVGGFLGFAAIPLLWFKRRTFDAKLITEAGAYGAVTGLTIATAMGLYKWKDMDQEGLEDRVYRLHYNRGQNRADGYGNAGFILGASLTSYAIWPPKPMHLLGGGVLGSFLGVMYSVATDPTPKKKKKPLKENQMIEELKH